MVKKYLCSASSILVFWSSSSSLSLSSSIPNRNCFHNLSKELLGHYYFKWLLRNERPRLGSVKSVLRRRISGHNLHELLEFVFWAQTRISLQLFPRWGNWFPVVEREHCCSLANLQHCVQKHKPRFTEMPEWAQLHWGVETTAWLRAEQIPLCYSTKCAWWVNATTAVKVISDNSVVQSLKKHQTIHKNKRIFFLLDLLFFIFTPQRCVWLAAFPRLEARFVSAASLSSVQQ